jgi:hypothetical protein
MRPETRSIVIAVLAGMMAAAYLESAGKVDLSFGFPDGGPAEGALIALTGAVVGAAVLLAFRGLRKLAGMARK